MEKLLTTVIAACALLGTGCQAGAPTATLHTQPAAAKRQLMAVEGGQPAPLISWSFCYKGTIDTESRVAPPDVPVVNEQGGIIRRDFVHQINYKYDFQQADVVFNGEGEVVWMGSTRFAYRVPAGRILVLNQASNVLAIDGVPLHGQGDAHLDQVYGPGELLLLSVRDLGLLRGYTGDPAMRGLPSGGGGTAAAETGK